MATKLVIVESPTKAHKIGDYLGKGYTVMASVGHIRDLAQPSQVPAADKAKFGKFGLFILKEKKTKKEMAFVIAGMILIALGGILIGITKNA